MMVLAAAAGFALAALTGLAIGKGGTTLAVQHNVRNTRQGNKLQTVVVRRGLAVYTLSGDTKANPLCTKANNCFAVWKPVKVGSKSKLTKAAGIKGKLGTFKRNGFHQVTLAGHPLYTFATDSSGVANGDLIPSFGGTWHLITVGAGGSTGTTPTMTTTTPTTPTMPTTTTCLYPPCY